MCPQNDYGLSWYTQCIKMCIVCRSRYHCHCLGIEMNYYHKNIFLVWLTEENCLIFLQLKTLIMPGYSIITCGLQRGFLLTIIPTKRRTFATAYTGNKYIKYS